MAEHQAEQAMQQMTSKIESLDDDEVGPYFVLCMAVLTKHAPDVARFVMDRADAALASAEAGSTPGREASGG